MRNPCLTLCGLLMMSCCAGCGVTLGPQSKTEIVIVRAGRPMQVTQNVKVQGKFAGSENVVTQDIGGWVTMPREHYEALMRAVSEQQPEKADTGGF